jgi:hypothetical protein
MARENQGLQIALIIFVMLTIVLGVTTYLFFRQSEEADIKAKKNATDLANANKSIAKNEDDIKELKRLILGAANADKVAAITSTTFSDDMKKYGGSYPEEVRFYHPLLEKLSKTIDERNAALAAVKSDNQTLEDKVKTFEANKQPQIEGFQKAAEAANKDRDAELAKFKSDRDRITQEKTKLQSDLESARKDADASLGKIKQQLQDKAAQIVKLGTVNKALSEKQAELTAQKFEVPSGEIRWVNQHTGTAWIDLGRGDNLQRQITFGVYPADITNMTAGGKKASIEVTQILGDHLAEVHVFDDKATDPIMPGDKIYTPIWMPGEKRHFALAGLMDPNGEGKNDVQAVKDIITINGGVVDCYVDEKGKKVGRMTINTRYLVLGDAPNDKSQPGTISGLTQMRDDADHLGVQKIQLNDLLQRMGWKNRTPILRYGQGANPKDFAAKPLEGEQQKKSAGSASDVFQPRKPPARTPANAY